MYLRMYRIIFAVCAYWTFMWQRYRSRAMRLYVTTMASSGCEGQAQTQTRRTQHTRRGPVS
jgi:hypothetical protein